LIKLFWAPRSCALASHITLEEVDVEYTTQRLDFSANEQRSPEYLAINPKGRVPALVTDKGVLTETPAILIFLAQSHPAAKIAPLDDQFTLAHIQSFNSYLCSTLHVAHAHRLRPQRWTDDPDAMEAMRRKVPESVAACFEHVERDLFVGPWVMGDTYTICDPYLFTVAQWMEADGIDPGRFPRVLEHRHRMMERRPVQKAVAAEAV
jgi:glutathione S-transferase